MMDDRHPHVTGTRQVGSDSARPMLGFLFSYWYCKRKDLDRLLAVLKPRPPIFADSGAFSARELGGTIDVHAYAEWVHRWHGWFDYYANLDCIGDPEGSLKNLEYLESQGLKPIPVFHGGEPWSVLRDMAADHDYLALGGIAGYSVKAKNPKVVGWLDQCFELSGSSKVHGFGLSDWPLVQRYPWESVDSSSIGSGYRYGSVKTYDPYSKKWINWRVNDKRAWGRLGWLVREYGLEPRDFKDPRSRECTANLMRLATRSMQQAIKDIPDTQMYVVDDFGNQAGLRRVEVFNQANVTMYLADTILQPGSLETLNEVNG